MKPSVLSEQVRFPAGSIPMRPSTLNPHLGMIQRLVVDYDRCAHCGACVPVCPPDSITLHEATLLINQATCTRCERCVVICPTGALKLSRV